MLSKTRFRQIKTTAEELKSKLPAEISQQPMRLLEEHVGLKSHSRFKRMSIGTFLNEVSAMKANIPEPYCVRFEALLAVSKDKAIIFDTETLAEDAQPENFQPTKILGKGDNPLFERILETIHGALSAMKNSGQLSITKVAVMLEHFLKSCDFNATREKLGCTRQAIESNLKNFNTSILEGKAWKRLECLYTIDSQLLKDIHSTIPHLYGQSIDKLQNTIGQVDGKSLDYILSMLDFQIEDIDDRQVLIERNKRNRYTKIAEDVRRVLSKSVVAIPIKKLSEGLSTPEQTFLTNYLSSQPDVIFKGEDNVMMTGLSLDIAVRQARIIFEAGTWISKADIAHQYELLYGEPMTALRTASLHKLGCTNHNKLGYWIYGEEKVGKVKDVIRSIMTPEKPIATFSTLYKAIRAKGFLYPEGTIRTCITDLACPENKNHDLFCLKGYTHLYPSLSWRSYKRPPEEKG